MHLTMRKIVFSLSYLASVGDASGLLNKQFPKRQGPFEGHDTASTSLISHSSEPVSAKGNILKVFTAVLLSLNGGCAFNPAAAPQGSSRLGAQEAYAALHRLHCATSRRHSQPSMEVTLLDSESFFSTIESCDKIAVVKFFAPWCQTCKRIGPEFEKVSKAYDGKADFFEVNFKKSKDVIKAEQVLVLPTIRFYAPNVGCVERFSLTFVKRKKLTQKLESILASGNLEKLRALDPEVLSPIVRFKELVGAVQAIKKAPEYLKEKDIDFITDRQKEHLRELFRLMDRDGNGVIDPSEFAGVCLALQAGTGKDAVEACDLESQDEIVNILMAAAGDNEMHEVDEAAFIRLMAHRSKEEATKEDTLLDAFKALDVDGSGTVEVHELVDVIKGVQGALGEDLGDLSNEKMEQLFEAFGLEDQQSGSVNYEEFVNMVVGRS
mmetsp:Transcript_89273/g.171207  ORF Transcript_89273/g.171207 Transcript_89273/m.171207 type:complete len:436 (-) Transcript_89273:156-1463(-)